MLPHQIEERRIKQLQELSKGKLHWNRWRQQHPEDQVYLHSLTLDDLGIGFLYGFDFSRANLANSDFESGHFTNVNFKQAILKIHAIFELQFKNHKLSTLNWIKIYNIRNIQENLDEPSMLNVS